MGGKAGTSTKRQIIHVDQGTQLCTWKISDASELFSCVDRNRARLRAWMPWLDMSSSVTEVRRFLESCVAEYQCGPSFRLGVFVDGRVAGVISLEGIDPVHHKAKIGYWLSKEHEGGGMMTRAVSALIGYGFDALKLNILEIRAATENHRSRAVAERVGMRLDGILRQRERLYDHFVDHAVYSLLASEWEDRPRRP